jgi:hypothetical protein
VATEPKMLSAEEKKKITSKDFRTVVVSTLGGGTNDNLAQLTFGLEVLDHNTQEEIIMEEVRLVMTPRTLKLVQRTLTSLLETLEAAIGEIPVALPPAPRITKNSSE